MKKFAANYLITDSGAFLKNGIIVSEDNGIVRQYIDTTNELKEIAQLTFHNGILLAGCTFLKLNNIVTESENSFNSMVIKVLEESKVFSLTDLIELGKLIQAEFPEKKIPEVLNRCMDILISNFGLTKETIPGIYLLTGVDLPQLRFKPTTKLKRIL